MKLSENSNYLKYMHLVHKKEYSLARQALKECIDDARVEDDKMLEAYLQQAMATLFYLDGQVGEAKKCFDSSEKTDPNSFLIRFNHAVFLTDKLVDFSLGVEKCDETIAMIKEGNIDDRASQEKFLILTYALKGYCLYKLEKKEEAVEAFRLINLSDEQHYSEYVINLCELLLKSDLAKDEVVKYLLLLKSRMDANDHTALARISKLIGH